MRFIYTKAFAYFSILLAVALLLTLLHVKGWLKPVESAVAEIPRPFIYAANGTGNFTKSFFSFFGSVSNLTQANTEMRSQITDLQEQLVSLEQFKLENEVLKKELGYRDNIKFNLASAD